MTSLHPVIRQLCRRPGHLVRCLTSSTTRSASSSSHQPNTSTPSTPPPQTSWFSAFQAPYSFGQSGTNPNEYIIPRHLVTTSHELPPHRIAKVCGLVQGNTVRYRNFVTDRLAGFRALFGGEVKIYTNLLSDAREEAVQRMLKHAVSLGANAVVSVRLATGASTAQGSEMIAFGTAVVVEPSEDEIDQMIAGVAEVNDTPDTHIQEEFAKQNVTHTDPSEPTRLT